MVVSLKHNFTSPIPDAGSPDEVGPDEWNAEHLLTLSTDRLLGRDTAGTGAAEELSVTGGLAFSGSGALTTTGVLADLNAAGASSSAADVTFNTVAVDQGTALLPSYTFAGDLNTGAFSPGGNTYAISTAGSQRFSVGAAGNVNIDALGVPIEANSTNSNAFKLQWSDAGTARGFAGASSTFAFMVGDNLGATAFAVHNSTLSVCVAADGTALLPVFSRITDDNTGIFFPADNEIAISTDGTERFRIGSTGVITGPSGTWDSGGMDIAASDSYSVAGTAILSDAAGTMTLSNIDALDATTESTIESALDTLSNLTTVGILNSGSITSGFGSINIGTSALSCGAVTSATTGVPIIANSTNSNAAKFRWQDAGVTRGFLGASGTYSLLVQDEVGNVDFAVRTASQSAEAGADGSVGSPVFTRLTDTNTGMYFPATDELGFTTGGAFALLLDSNQSVVTGPSGALATTATDGFLYIPTCAGTPTGTPTAKTGKVPMVFDTTNNVFYIYDGSWLGGTNPGAFT